MKTTLIAFAAAAGFAAVTLAAGPSAAASLSHGYTQPGFSVQHVRDGHRWHQRRPQAHRPYFHRPHRPVVRRHFWAPGPWAFRGVPYHQCFRVGSGYVCYF